MAELLIDTDVLVDHLRGTRRLEAAGGLGYSVITRAELFAGPEQQLDSVRALLGPMRELGLDGPIAELAGGIRREAQIPLPDAIIAATALRNGLSLLSGNARHFERVAGLAVRSPA